MPNKKKMLLIADVSNLYYCIALRFGPQARLDYKKFYDRATQDSELFKAVAYGAELDGVADAFKTALRHIGFELKYKEPKRYPNAKNPDREARKADWDVGIAMDIVRLLGNVDRVVLGTADGDLAPCVQYIRDAGKECQILACGISRELKDISNHWTEIPEELLKCNTQGNHSNVGHGMNFRTNSYSISTE